MGAKNYIKPDAQIILERIQSIEEQLQELSKALTVQIDLEQPSIEHLQTNAKVEIPVEKRDSRTRQLVGKFSKANKTSENELQFRTQLSVSGYLKKHYVAAINNADCTMSSRITMRTAIDGIIHNQENALVDRLELQQSTKYGSDSKWAKERRQSLERKAASLGLHRPT